MAVADITRFQELLAQEGIKSALIILPQNPSVDAVASGLSLSQALEKRGYATTVSAPTPPTVEFNRLVGINRVREDLGDKNLILSFDNYPAGNIEKVSYNIDNGKFSLTVMPKPGNKAPGQEHVALNYAGISADVIIIVDANYPADLGKFAENPELAKSMSNVVLLGNTPLSGYTGAIELIDASGVSISETVYQIVQALKVTIDEDLATNLFMGLEAGTGNFTNPAVRAETFALAAELLKAGAKRGPALMPEMPQFGPTMAPRQTMPEDLAGFKDSTNLG